MRKKVKKPEAECSSSSCRVDVKNMVPPSQSPDFPGMVPAPQAPEVTRLSGYLRKTYFFLLYSYAFKNIAHELAAASNQFLGGPFLKNCQLLSIQILVFECQQRDAQWTKC